jgi:hypothetical protein
MQIALLHKHFDEAHLEQVKAEMSELGAPTVKAVWMECYGVWAALEGCHRIRAAAALGLEPEIEEVEYCEETTLVSLGLDCQDHDITVANVADDVARATIINF